MLTGVAVSLSEVAVVVARHCAGGVYVTTARKNVQIDVGDLDLRDSRLWAHYLSARMGLEVSGAM